MDEPGPAGREQGEDEVWRDLVARLDIPDAGGDGEPSPWPPEENGEPSPWPPEENVESWTDSARVIRPAETGTAHGTLTPASGEHVTGPADDPDDHYIPPPPPPLPRLDNVAKGAWLALFGGPAYLLIATIADWTVSAPAAFVAVAAFVGGFITLVLRMSDEDRDDSDPGNGAVV
ncbi:MAG: hypothetical protein ACM3ML_02085 [Micromonosporaceae bacterium]